MKSTRNVCIGLVGAGYAAYLHGSGYEKVSGVSVRVIYAAYRSAEEGRRVDL